MTWIEVTDTVGRSRIINTENVDEIRQVLPSDEAATMNEGVQSYIEMKVEFRSFMVMDTTDEIIRKIRANQITAR